LTSHIILQNSQLIHNQNLSLTAARIQLQNSLIRTQQQGDLRLIADTMQFENSQLSTDMLSQSQGGSIYLTAHDSIQLSGSIMSSSLGDLFHSAEGISGRIVIETPTFNGVG